MPEIPSHPEEIYRRQWKGWNNFLGVHPNTPEKRKNAQRDEEDDIRLAESDKVLLLEMARAGEPRPDPSTRLGMQLLRFTGME
jgi:hypothetical protein